MLWFVDYEAPGGESGGTAGDVAVIDAVVAPLRDAERAADGAGGGGGGGVGDVGHGTMPAGRALHTMSEVTHPHVSQPANGLPRREAVVLDHAERDECAGAAAPRLAVLGEGAGEALGERRKLGDDAVGRGRAVVGDGDAGDGEVGDGDAAERGGVVGGAERGGVVGGAERGGVVGGGLVEPRDGADGKLREDAGLVRDERYGFACSLFGLPCLPSRTKLREDAGLVRGGEAVAANCLYTEKMHTAMDKSLWLKAPSRARTSRCG